MKARLITLFSLLVLLLVSTAVLADGRPTGIRIGRIVGSGGSTTPTVEIDVTVTVGDAIRRSRPNSPYNGYIYAGNPIIAHTWYGRSTPGCYSRTFGSYSFFLAITANTTVNAGTGIPALNIYGLLAMAFVLVGAGLLVYRKPQQA